MRKSVHFPPPSAERLWRFTSGTQMALGLAGSNAGGCGVCARSSSTHSHVSPPSLERAIAPCSTPANSVLLFGCSMTYETTRSLSFLPDSFQLLPPSVDRHTPPPCVDTHSRSGFAGSRASDETFPKYGPSDFQEAAREVDAMSRSTVMARFINHSIELPVAGCQLSLLPNCGVGL